MYQMSHALENYSLTKLAQVGILTRKRSFQSELQIPASAPFPISIAVFSSRSPSPSSSSPAPVQITVFVTCDLSPSPSSPASFPVAISLRFGRAPACECPGEVSLPFPGHCLSSAPTPAALPCTGRSLVNLLVYCTRGLCFLKSVDATKIVKNAKNLFKIFDEAIQWIGVGNVVHVVTDNAANYKSRDLDNVKDVIQKARRVTVFVYNHTPVINWLKARTNWKQIVRPDATRFATNFLSMKSVYEHKVDVQALVVSEFFNAGESSNTAKGKVASAILLDAQFWGDCLEMVNVAQPVMKLLKLVDSDEKPTLAYVYEGMRRAIKGIKEIFLGKETLYKPYIDIVNKRWDKHFRGNLVKAAYFFNPALKYDEKEYVGDIEVKGAIINLLEKPQLCSDGLKACKELKLFEEAKGTFGRDLAVRGRSSLDPDYDGDDGSTTIGMASSSSNSSCASDGE
ncbi:unnamed protein product [Linum tenue]|uniref:DUF659 domain-containing protein n=1 Tax=Linum tenue TaxID=586396 RepID=A0AAV0PY51_9ROSI|nr:unnamed protein product [Linum tenue]CAI0476039.1 unnamed protein product [Linum tenue]